MNKHDLFSLVLAVFLSSFACHAQAVPEAQQARAETTTVLTPEIGGIKQVIEVKTDHPDKPILLFLSGGPGSSMMNNAQRYTGTLKQAFTIVQWDQRDAGKTLKRNASPLPLTLERMQRDTVEVVEFLRKTYRKEKIYLLGSSWGNVLGFHIVAQHPELVHAYFAVNPVVSQLASEHALLATLKRHFRDDAAASRELASVKIPFTVDEDLFYLRKWLFLKEGKAFAAGDDFRVHFLQWSRQWSPVWMQVMQIDLPKTLERVAVPTYFFVGAQDIQTSTRITQDYFARLQAPKKALFLFEQSGHQIHQDEPARLQDAIIETLGGVQDGASM